MKRPADRLHPVAPICQPNEGASRPAVRNEPGLRAGKSEIHLPVKHGDPPTKPRVIPAMIDESENAAAT